MHTDFLKALLPVPAPKETVDTWEVRVRLDSGEWVTMQMTATCSGVNAVLSKLGGGSLTLLAKGR